MSADEQNRPTGFPEPDQTEPELEQKLKEAEQLAEKKQFDRAEEILKEATEQFSDSAIAHHDLSVLYFLRLREDYDHLEVWEDLADDEWYFEAAVSEAEAALELEPEFTPARNNLGMLFACRGWWEDAVKQWETSLSYYPDQPEIREEVREARKHLD